MKNHTGITCFAALVLGYSQSAFAYLDPGTGSFMLQMLIAGVMGALYTIKLYWYRVKAFVMRVLGRPIEDAEDPLATDDSGN